MPWAAVNSGGGKRLFDEQERAERFVRNRYYKQLARLAPRDLMVAWEVAFKQRFRPPTDLRRLVVDGHLNTRLLRLVTVVQLLPQTPQLRIWRVELG